MKKIYYLYNSLILLGILDCMPELFAEEFDTSLLVGKSAQGDISRFYQNSEIPPGKQLVDIYVNDDWKGQFEVNIGEKNQNITIDARDCRHELKTGIYCSFFRQKQMKKGSITP